MTHHSNEPVLSLAVIPKRIGTTIFNLDLYCDYAYEEVQYYTLGHTPPFKMRERTPLRDSHHVIVRGMRIPEGRLTTILMLLAFIVPLLVVVLPLSFFISFKVAFGFTSFFIVAPLEIYLMHRSDKDRHVDYDLPQKEQRALIEAQYIIDEYDSRN